MPYPSCEFGVGSVNACLAVPLGEGHKRPPLCRPDVPCPYCIYARATPCLLRRHGKLSQKSRPPVGCERTDLTSRSLFDALPRYNLVHGTFCLERHIVGLTQRGMEAFYGRIAVLAVRGDFFQYGILRLLIFQVLYATQPRAPANAAIPAVASHRPVPMVPQRGGCAVRLPPVATCVANSDCNTPFAPTTPPPDIKVRVIAPRPVHACDCMAETMALLLSERHLAGTPHIQQSLYRADGRRRRRLSADKAHGDTDIGQGTGHLEQPDSHRSRKSKRF